MFRPLVRSHRRPPRRGTAILITCFFLITIMMVTGLALVMYAAREKAAALAFQDGAAVNGRSMPDPTNTANQFLGALIYDEGNGDLPNGSAVDANSRALQNALRGHSIARSMYGSRPDYSPPLNNPWVGTTTPWNGVGTFHEPADSYGVTALNGQDRGRFVNHTGLLVGGQFLQLDPEWTGARPVAAGAPPTLLAFATNVANRNYVSKAAGYTYPDLKNFWLGARDPATGEVLVQSFHRDSLFGPLAPNNVNWTNEVGKLLTLRPRPTEHPQFPRVPPNADGSYTGDVQNLPGSFRFVPGRGFIAMNDSLWMHIGLPPITLSDGRRVQPLVAPLILPLDGSFDLSHHGSEFNAVVTPGPTPTPVTTYTHASHSGKAPWEINLGVGTANTTDAYNLLAQRKNAPSRTASEFNPYVNAQRPAAGQQQLLPRYAPVSWSGALVNFRLPSEQTAADRVFMLGLPSSGNPNFSGGADGGFQNDNAQVPNHPAGYNSNDFGPRNNTSNPNSPVYPWTDLKRLTLRYAYYPDWYSQAFVTRTASATFQGNLGTFPYFANPTVNLQSNYRLDPAHARRGLFVPRTMTLDRPALSPTFLSRDAATALALVPPTPVPNAPLPPGKPGALVPPNTSFPAPQNPGTVTDFAPTLNVGGGTTQQWYNFLTQLGSVNLNRPLADYRELNLPPNVNNSTTPPTFTPQPLGPGNMLNAAAADADRQALAKDIFARLIIATGAAGVVSFDATNGVQIELPNPNNRMIRSTGYTPEQYNALRYLAQVAVNIVDYIDNDDISTTFVWNGTGNPMQDMRPDNLGERVVFGVEKPRLLINEVYSEITNDPMDKIEGDPDPADNNQPMRLPATAKAHVRFWAELVNATSAPHALPTGVLGTGAVPLNAYQIQIARAERRTDVMKSVDRASFLSSPANSSGLFGDAMGNLHAPDATFTFPLNPVAPTPASVAPNDVSLGAQQYAPPPADLPAGGFVLVGPPSQRAPVKTGSKEFNPPTTGIWAQANKVDSPDPGPATTSAGMGYTLTMPDAPALSTAEFKRHVVLLRRLANPYLPANNVTNPYITVDVMDYVPSFDAVHRAKEERTDRGPWDATNRPNGYDPVANRFSVGKVQPLAGLSFATLTNGKGTTGGYNVYNGNNTYAPTSSLTSSMVRDQTAAPTLAPGTDEPNEPKNTFGRHNGNGPAAPGAATVTAPLGTAATLSDTVQFPFDWLIHMDRPLETQGELFFVRDCPPHRLTTEFVYPVVPPVATSPGLNYTVGTARWAQHSDGLARALELLTVKSPKLTDAHGGRVGGKVNPNVMQDSRVAQGVWDAPAALTTPPTGNRFDQAFVTNTVWGVTGSGTGWMNSRSPLQDKTQANGTSTNPVPVPLGQVADMGGLERPFMPYGGPTVPYPVAPAMPPTSGQFAYTAPPATNDGDTIMRINPATGVPYLHQTTEAHPYTRTEPLRKVMNNLTPVSHTFVVYFTIGYFEVNTPAAPAGWPSNVPVPPQFGHEVYDQIPGDMRQKYIAVVDMSNMALDPVNPAHATVQPFFTALTATARPGANVPLTLASGGGDTTGTNFSIPADGQTVTFQAGAQLVIGYGSETQVVAVNAVGPRAPNPMDPNYPNGLAANQIGVTNLVRTAWGGTCVSNVRPGYVGPQPSFNFTSPAYRPVVPYVERLR